MIKTTGFRLVLLIAASLSLNACSSQSPQDGYNDFQYALLSQGALLLVEQDGYRYAASWLDGMILESQPPKIRVTLGDATQTAGIQQLYSPLTGTQGRVAQALIDGQWQQIDYRLRGYRFEIHEEGQWQPTANIRFVER